MPNCAGRGGDTLDAEIDALFQLPPGAFTAARNALAARLKKGGRGDAAEQVRSLARPSVTAWAVNHLYWRHRAAFARLLEAGVPVVDWPVDAPLDVVLEGVMSFRRSQTSARV